MASQQGVVGRCIRCKVLSQQLLLIGGAPVRVNSKVCSSLDAGAMQHQINFVAAGVSGLRPALLALFHFMTEVICGVPEQCTSLSQCPCACTSVLVQFVSFDAGSSAYYHHLPCFPGHFVSCSAHHRVG